MKDDSQQTYANTLLDDIEAELRRQNMWMREPPSVAALSSTAPFCMDTLSFSQWLQWMLVPRLRGILESGALLPKGSHIRPYAEEAIGLEPMEATALLGLIDQLDHIMA